MNWRAAMWARWLGWTLVFGCVIAGSWMAYEAALPMIPGFLPGWLYAAPAVIVALLIGERVRSWWWVAGPAAGCAVVAGFFAVWLLAGPRSSGDWVELAVIVVASVATIVGVVCGVAAAAGVWWGKRQDAHDAFG